MIDLWRLTATEAVAKPRKGEVSPLELVDAAAAGIEVVEPRINALPIRFHSFFKHGVLPCLSNN